MIYHILQKAWFKVGIMSTISLDVGNGKISNQSKNKLTSLTHRDFAKHMRQARKNGLEYMVVEPSSHAIYQYRFWPAKFIAVGITNLTHEHLDFHQTMDHYFMTKAQIFYKRLYKHSIGIMPYNFQFKSQLQHKSKVTQLLHFSQDQESSIYAQNIQEHPQIEFQLNIDEKHFNHQDKKLNLSTIHIKSQLLWRFNIDNMMIAAGICKHLQVTNNDIKAWLDSFQSPAGRVEELKLKSGTTVIVDFALTPHALTQLYTSFQKLHYNKQIAVFGATGNRDKKKRPQMWKIATELNDFVFITEDENYDEDGKDIIANIQSGIDNKNYSNYKIVQDRKSAIQEAIRMAGPHDVILLTGMGNFDTRKMGKQQIPRNDKKVVLECDKQT